MTSWVGIVIACVVGVGCGGKHEPERVPAPAPAPATAPPTPPSSPYRRDVDALLKDVVGLQERRDALTQEINGASAIVTAATTDSTRQATRTKLATLRTQLDELAGLIAGSTKRADELQIVDPEAVTTTEQGAARKDVMDTQERLAQLAGDRADLDKRLTEASDTLIMAQNDADRASAKARLELLRKEQAELKKSKR